MSEPTRIMIAPSCIAASKSRLIPIYYDTKTRSRLTPAVPSYSAQPTQTEALHVPSVHIKKRCYFAKFQRTIKLQFLILWLS